MVEIENKTSIVCLSTQDFDDLWTRKQRFMTRFAQEGHRVLYIEAQWHWVTYFRRFKNNGRRIWAFLRKPQPRQDNLFVSTPPLLLPFFQMSTPIALVNNLVMGLWLRWITRRLRMDKPLVYTYVPYSHLAIRILGSRNVLYEKVDDLAAARGLVRRKTVERLEQRLLRITRLVIVTATRLKAMLNGTHANVHIIPNACEVEHFSGGENTTPAPERLRAIPQPRIGFVGMLAYWIDLDLLEHIARSRPEWQLVFLGPVGTDVSQLKPYRNIHLLGRIDYSELPRYMAHIGCFVNPYKCDDIAESCSPLKVFEYLAAGKPVVSVPMPEIARFAEGIHFAESYTDFVDCIETALETARREGAVLTNRLRALVKNEDWDDRYGRTRRLVRENFGI